MRHNFSSHARDRAIERYGRDFEPDELNAIYRTCVDGRAFRGRISDDGTSFYRITLPDGLVICPVLAREKTFIVTFLPSDFFVATHRRKAAQAAGLLKQVFAGPKDGGPRPYRRERINMANLLLEED